MATKSKQVDVESSKAALLGRIGFGEKISAEMVVLGENGQVDSHDLKENHAGKIVLAPTLVGREFLNKALFLNLAGLVVGSVHWRDFNFVHQLREKMTLVVLGRFGQEELTNEMKTTIRLFAGRVGRIFPDKDTYVVEANS